METPSMLPIAPSLRPMSDILVLRGRSLITTKRIRVDASEGKHATER